jgi:hypothetical protein
VRKGLAAGRPLWRPSSFRSRVLSALPSALTDADDDVSHHVIYPGTRRARARAQLRTASSSLPRLKLERQRLRADPQGAHERLAEIDLLIGIYTNSRWNALERLRTRHVPSREPRGRRPPVVAEHRSPRPRGRRRRAGARASPSDDDGLADLHRRCPRCGGAARPLLPSALWRCDYCAAAIWEQMVAHELRRVLAEADEITRRTAS